MRLLEREKELAAIEERIEGASDGAGSMVLVEGSAGIGKTALLEAAAARAGSAGLEVLSARGGELERTLSYGIARQLFERRLAEASDAERAELLSGAAALSEGALTGLGEDAAETDRAGAIQHGLYWLTANLAEHGGLLLIVDDVQWSDAPSLRWLVYIARRLPELPIIAIVACRTGEPGVDAATLAALASEPAVTVLRPGVLSGSGSAEIVRERLGPGPTDAFAAACAQASGGNPFLLGELVTAIERDRIPTGDDAVTVVESLAPEAISRSILLRLARMPTSADPLARAAAVLGARAELETAADLAAVTPDEAAALADALTAGAILAEGFPLRFAHPLIASAVYDQIPAAERELLHGRAARLLADRGADDEEVAGQLLRAQVGEGEWAIERLRQAAERARGRGSPQAAVAYLRRAFAEPAPSRRLPLLVDLSHAAWRAYDTAAFEGISEDPVAEIEADPAAFMEAGPDLSAWLFSTGRLDAARALADAGIEAERDAGELDRALEHEIGLLAIFHIEPDEALARLERYGNAVEPGTRGERLWLAMRGWWMHFAGGPAAAAADLAERALDDGALLAEQPDLPVVGQAILVLLRADRLDRAEVMIDALEKDARRRSSLGSLAIAGGLRSQLALRRGEVGSAVEDARAALAIPREQGIIVALPIGTAFLLDALVQIGAHDEAESEIEASGLVGDLPVHFWFTPARWSRARLRAAQGRRDEAIADLRFALEQPLPVDYAVDSALAELLAAEGETAEAKRLAAAGVARARDWGTASAIGIALRAQALVDGGTDAIERLREAVAALADSPNRLEHARALTDLGAALRRANQRSEARDLLAEAMEMAHRGGATSVAERAATELAATGAKPRRVMLSGVESLTPSELRVCRMAADGMENREIAQALFVTVKTIETHLTSAYRKLDIGSRRELPDALS